MKKTIPLLIVVLSVLLTFSTSTEKPDMKRKQLQSITWTRQSFTRYRLILCGTRGINTRLISDWNFEIHPINLRRKANKTSLLGKTGSRRFAIPSSTVEFITVVFIISSSCSIQPISNVLKDSTTRQNLSE